ncbi:hypothetical protein EXIGLDRAFT_744018 [Exidia glandulosa HHB12029]|uniref:F-box domain-containing protein n=1 Tax=Exidia glandulosa HHB12029 TaxID=1314781 RepID=A0A165QIC5_EXIGL|nr:hypothetical protein EXIGLDRAFT_744018 [Exidia glandulosa HHB12029]
MPSEIALPRHLGPITRLPVELLGLSWTSLSFKDRLAVSHVSRAWRAIAVSCPALWTDIHLWSRSTSDDISSFTHNAAAGVQCFARSKSLACRVTFTLHGEAVDPLFRSAIIHLLSTNYTRIDSLEVNTTCCKGIDSWMRDIFDNLPRLPFMRSLHLHSIPRFLDLDTLGVTMDDFETSWYSSWGHPLKLFAPDTVLGPRFPYLREVSVDVLFLECVSAPLPGVERVKCYIYAMRSLERVLQAFPSLSSLTIVIECSWSVTDVNDMAESMIDESTAPNLVALHVTNCTHIPGLFYHPNTLGHAYPKRYSTQYQHWPHNASDWTEVFEIYEDVEMARQMSFHRRHRRLSLSAKDPRGFSRTLYFPADSVSNSQRFLDLGFFFHWISTSLTSIAVDAELWRWLGRFLERVPSLKRIVVFVGRSGLPNMYPVCNPDSFHGLTTTALVPATLSRLQIVELRAMRGTRVAATVDKVITFMETVPGRPMVLKLVRIKMHPIAATLLSVYAGKVVFA